MHYNETMFLKMSIILFLTGISVFAQTGEREQGLVSIEPYWRHALGGAVLSLPSVQAQSAVVALDGGNIRAYSTLGTPMWNYSARGRISPYVSRSREGTSYFSRTNGTLIALNRSGRELWRRDLGSALTAPVVTGWDGRLFAPTEKRISCFTASGTLLWEINFDKPFSIPPKLDRNGGIIVAVSSSAAGNSTVGNNEAYRISQFGKIDKLEIAGNIAALLSLDRERIAVLYTDGTIQINNNEIPAKFHSAPVAAANRGNNIAAVFRDGTVSLMSLDEGKILWNGESHIRELSKSGARIEEGAEALFDDRGIYILSKNGATGFSHNGQRLWYIFLQNTAAIPAFADDGVLYSGGRDWILYAYKIEDRTYSARGNIYAPAPEGVYGTGYPKAVYSGMYPIIEQELIYRLEQISSGIETGRVSVNEEALTSLLMMIAESQSHIIYRLAALNLIGKIGSQETIPWLTDFFRREIDTTVRSAAINAIGAIGVDPEGQAIQAFLFFIINAAETRDEQVLIAITRATGALCRFSGPPLSESGIRILNLLSASRYPQSVRRHAQIELNSLR